MTSPSEARTDRGAGAAPRGRGQTSDEVGMEALRDEGAAEDEDSEAKGVEEFEGRPELHLRQLRDRLVSEGHAAAEVPLLGRPE